MTALDRYDVLMNFKLNEDKWVKDSTFINEDKLICRLLCVNGFIKARAKSISIEVRVTNEVTKTHITKMNRKELDTLAEQYGLRFADGTINAVRAKKIKDEMDRLKGKKK